MFQCEEPRRKAKLAHLLATGFESGSALRHWTLQLEEDECKFSVGRELKTEILENNMSLKTSVVSTFGAFLLLFTCSAAFAAGEDACSLLTQAQVSSMLGTSVGVGQHPSEEMHTAPANPAIDRLACTWYENGKSSFVAKRVSLNVLGTLGSLTPVERFNNAKTPVRGITKTPVTGVGDDALFMVSQLRVTLHVQKGNSVFEIMVGGFSAKEIEQVKTMEKSLAQDVVAKL
jgi:hypothetical protein